MKRRDEDHRTDSAAAGQPGPAGLALLLSRARAQSHELADRRAAQLFPIALPPVDASRWRSAVWLRSRPAWALASVVAVLVLGISATWAVMQRGTPRVVVPQQALGDVLAAASRTVGPAPLKRHAKARPAVRQQMAVKERSVVAPMIARRAEPAARPEEPEGKMTSIVLDGPQETVIIVSPPAKHGPLWTPKDFSRYMRHRIGRGQ